MSILINNLSFKYDQAVRPAVHEVNLEIEPGSRVGIVGASGSGKTSLLYAIAGIIPHSIHGDFYGHVTVGGQDTFETPLVELTRNIGIVFEEIDNMFVTTQVEDELLYAPENFGVSHNQIAERVQAALSMFGIEELRHLNLSELSGGQRQKVALATVFAQRPQVYLLDEPMTGLDPASRSDLVSSCIAAQGSHQATTIMFSRNIESLIEFSERLIVMDRGAVVLDGPTDEVLSQVETLESYGVNPGPLAHLTSRLKQAGYLSAITTHVERAVSEIGALLCKR